MGPSGNEGFNDRKTGGNARKSVGVASQGSGDASRGNKSAAYSRATERSEYTNYDSDGERDTLAQLLGDDDLVNSRMF